jgi:hypothetical protein
MKDKLLNREIKISSTLNFDGTFAKVTSTAKGTSAPKFFIPKKGEAKISFLKKSPNYMTQSAVADLAHNVDIQKMEKAMADMYGKKLQVETDKMMMGINPVLVGGDKFKYPAGKVVTVHKGQVKEDGMALKITKKKDGYEVLKKLGVDSLIIKEAQEVGIEVKFLTEVAKFSINKTHLTSYTYKAGTVALIEQQILGVKSYEAFQFEFQKLLEETVLSAAKLGYHGAPKKEDLDDVYQAAKKLTPNVTDASGIVWPRGKTAFDSLKKAKPITEVEINAQGEVVEGKVTNKDGKVYFGNPKTKGPIGVNPIPLDLVDATALYQRVKGSSPDSIYYVVGLCATLKAAVRLKNNAISFRVEGAIDSHAESLVAAGFKLHGKYASMHLQTEDKALAKKSVGALLASMSVPFTTPMPQLDQLFGQGV